MTLDDLVLLLRAHVDGALALDALRGQLTVAMNADQLGAHGAARDADRWAGDHDAERLLWRLVHLWEAEVADEPASRALATRVLACLDDAGAAGTAFELLPLVRDLPRLCTIVDRHASGIISRTGFLGVLAESSYPPHVKLWLEHASLDALVAQCTALREGRWRDAATTFERAR